MVACCASSYATATHLEINSLVKGTPERGQVGASPGAERMEQQKRNRRTESRKRREQVLWRATIVSFVVPLAAVVILMLPG